MQQPLATDSTREHREQQENNVNLVNKKKKDFNTHVPTAPSHHHQYSNKDDHTSAPL